MSATKIIIGKPNGFVREKLRARANSCMTYPCVMYFSRTCRANGIGNCHEPFRISSVCFVRRRSRISQLRSMNVSESARVGSSRQQASSRATGSSVYVQRECRSTFGNERCRRLHQAQSTLCIARHARLVASGLLESQSTRFLERRLSDGFVSIH